MKNTIHIYGCSFSEAHLDITTTDTYGQYLADSLGMVAKNYSRAGCGNEYLHLHLCKSINDIKDGDVVIYQFTGFNRLEFWEDIHNLYTYVSSAGIFSYDNAKTHHIDFFNKLNETEVEIMLNWNTHFQDYRKPSLVVPTVELLNHLKKEKNIKVMYLHMTNECYKMNNDILILPTSKDRKNVGMVDYFIDSKLTLSDYDSTKYGKLEFHPSIFGHQKIAKIIETKLLSKKLI